MENSFAQGRDMGDWYGGGTDEQQNLHKASIQTNIGFNQKMFLIFTFFGTETENMWIESQIKKICEWTTVILKSTKIIVCFDELWHTIDESIQKIYWMVRQVEITEKFKV